MPEAVALGGAGSDAPCARCKRSNADLVVRSERLCEECFMRYVGSKLIKRLQTNKLRGGFHEVQKTLLVPVAFDVSSISLLHGLDQHLRKQLESGRHAGYTLHVLCIDESCIREDSRVQRLLPFLKQRFPEYAYSVVSLEDCLTYGIDLKPLTYNRDGGALDEEPNAMSQLQNLLSTLPSATSRADVVDILRRRLTAAVAKQNDCDSILYSDSTTKLADRILAETAKGRGGVLPWLTSDNAVTDGVPCIYPLRDLLQKELALYVDLSLPSLEPLVMAPEITKGITSSKDMTIDALMCQYFESVEESFPSIVANVVRTSSKLAPPLELACAQLCDFCRLPVNDVEWRSEQGSHAPVNQSHKGETQSPQHLCSGCARTLLRT